MHEAVAAIAACGVSPLVRVADNQGWMVKRALDAGAHGIIVPLLNTAADAQRLVASAKFPPLGGRGFGSDARDVHEEGVLFPPMHLARRGELNESLLQILRANVRQPLLVEGDLHSLVACNERGSRRLRRVRRSTFFA